MALNLLELFHSKTAHSENNKVLLVIVYGASKSAIVSAT